MWNRICVLFLAFVTALPALADEDDWDKASETSAPVAEAPAPAESAPAVEPAPVAEPTPAAEQPPVTETSPKSIEKKEDPFAKLEAAKAPVDTTPKPAVGREVPVRYWVMGDSVEQEAIFVKIERDTVYLKRPNAEEQKNLEKLQEETIAAMEESNGQHQEEDASQSGDLAGSDLHETLEVVVVKLLSGLRCLSLDLEAEFREDVFRSFGGIFKRIGCS